MSLIHILRNRSSILKEKTVLYRSGAALCSQGDPPDKPDTKVSGYAQSYEKFEAIKDHDDSIASQTFATLLRNSKFIDLGDPAGKIVNGKIFHVVDDDLYIDFGWKFHCVCPRPKKSPSSYIRGAKVRLRINELELSSKFLGYEKDLTLLEADCVLLGLVRERSKNTQ